MTLFPSAMQRCGKLPRGLSLHRSRPKSSKRGESASSIRKRSRRASGLSEKLPLCPNSRVLTKDSTKQPLTPASWWQTRAKQRSKLPEKTARTLQAVEVGGWVGRWVVGEREGEGGEGERGMGCGHPLVASRRCPAQSTAAMLPADMHPPPRTWTLSWFRSGSCTLASQGRKRPPLREREQRNLRAIRTHTRPLSLLPFQGIHGRHRAARSWGLRALLLAALLLIMLAFVLPSNPLDQHRWQEVENATSATPATVHTEHP